MAGRSRLLLCGLLVVIAISAVAGGQQSTQTIQPGTATVETPVMLNTTHARTVIEQTGLRDWEVSPDDEAAFYRASPNTLTYYDAEANTAHVVSRPSGQTFLAKDLASPSKPEFVDPSNEWPRYTQRGTIAIGTNYGPMIYDVSSQRWLTEPNQSLEGHPVEPWTTTHPSRVVATEEYYVMSVNSNLLLASENWTNHVVAPPGDPERFRANDTHVSTNARAVAYEPWVEKVGYPIVFRGAIGITDRYPDDIAFRVGGPDWPVWEPENENLTYFAPPGMGPTNVYDGPGTDTIIIDAGHLIAYNVSTASEVWRRSPPQAQWMRHDDKLVMHHRWINLTTGNATGLYPPEGHSMFQTEVNGTRVIGEFEDVDSISPDGTYAVVMMEGASDLGKYRTRGVRVLNLETQSIAAQRTILGSHDARWADRQRGYRAAVGGGHAVVASPATLNPDNGNFNGTAQVIDLATNETVDAVPYLPGRLKQLRATEDGLLLVPQLPWNASRDRIPGYGPAEGNYTVYDTTRTTAIGDIPITLAANETVGAVKVRSGDLFMFTRKDGQTIIREYDGLDGSPVVTASPTAAGVTLAVSTVDGTPRSNVTLEVADQRVKTNASGQVRVDLDPPASAGNETYPLRMAMGERVHRTNLTVHFESTSTSPINPGGEGGTVANGPGVGLLGGLLGIVLSFAWVYRRRV